MLSEDALPDSDSASICNRLTKQDVLEALKSSKSGTFTKINGLPYELWKILNDKYEANTKVNGPINLSI